MKRPFLLLLFPFLLCSCTRTCEEYPSNLVYFPNWESTEFQFKNENNEVLVLNGQAVKTEQGQLSSECRTCECPEKYNEIRFSDFGHGYVHLQDGIRCYLCINGNEFYTTWRVKDTIYVPHIEEPTKCALVVKNKGIISFYDKNKNCTWKLVED